MQITREGNHFIVTMQLNYMTLENTFYSGNLDKDDNLIIKTPNNNTAILTYLASDDAIRFGNFYYKRIPTPTPPK